MTFQRVNKSSWNSPKEKKISPFAPRRFANQTKKEPDVPLTQEDIENAAYDQHKFDGTGLEIKEEYGTITPAEREHLGVLQAKMKDFWVQRREKPSGFNYNFANVKVHTPDELARIEPRLTIGKPGVRLEQEADSVAADMVQQKRTELQRSQPPVVGQMLQTASLQENESSKWKSEATGDCIGASGVHRENKTGLPDNLKAGIENLSGMSMDDVKVHYNSDKPPQVQALAYTQGSDIYVESGQEKHLAHEAWHVVQQKQGRVKPTLQAKGVAINDDEGLEKEADVMGERATWVGDDSLQRKEVNSSDSVKNNSSLNSSIIIQRVVVKLTEGLDSENPSTYDVGGGHSYADHGAHTTEEQHRERLRSGKCPSGRISRVPSGKGSGKFASDEKHKEAFKQAHTDLQDKNKNKQKVKGAAGTIAVDSAGISYFRDGTTKDCNKVVLDIVPTSDDTIRVNSMYPVSD